MRPQPRRGQAAAGLEEIAERRLHRPCSGPIAPVPGAHRLLVGRRQTATAADVEMARGWGLLRRRRRRLVLGPRTRGERRRDHDQQDEDRQEGTRGPRGSHVQVGRESAARSHTGVPRGCRLLPLPVCCLPWTSPAGPLCCRGHDVLPPPPRRHRHRCRRSAFHRRGDPRRRDLRPRPRVPLRVALRAGAVPGAGGLGRPRGAAGGGDRQPRGAGGAGARAGGGRRRWRRCCTRRRPTWR